MKKQEIFDSYKDYILPTYTRLNAIFTKGKGSKLWDIDGKEYLDFFPGWGVSNLGHCHPNVIAAVREQIGKLIHIPNNLYHPLQAKLAKEIIYWSFEGKVFFCNSGAEANEAAIKFARAYGSTSLITSGKGNRYEIISFKNSFHGRTLAALTATGQDKYKQGFAPLVEGFKIVEFNNLDQVKQALSDKTIAIMLELIQGEGGINVAEKDFILGLRKLCDEKDLLLIIDEVQTGIGRTGKMFCFQNYDIKPDIMTLAKALGGGLPIGAMVVKKEFSDTLGPGMHASTFGGNPLVCRAALGVFRAIQKEKMLVNVAKMSEYLFSKLEKLKDKYSQIIEVRGMGLMIGIELNIEGKYVVERALEKGLLINCTHETILRLMPAINVNKKQIDKAVAILDDIFSKG
ncbi:MAG: aspartate aminotransferase family protein [Candidatus Omnitrophica bacterium]|nr:aspartate aminotransferase family protein [Candidatus Omnitrophota bacterium]